jgi:hypothetical protein
MTRSSRSQVQVGVITQKPTAKERNQGGNKTRGAEGKLGEDTIGNGSTQTGRNTNGAGRCG